jgi:fatty acid desaturase
MDARQVIDPATMSEPTHDSSGPGSNEPPAGAKDEIRARVLRINAAIRAASRDLRARHPVLRHQDAIGLGILFASVGAVGAAALGYARGGLSAWATVLAVAFATSIAHEIEHDLIHDLYFRQKRSVHNAMMALCWLVRPNTFNPWVRRGMHLNHHRLSGTPRDLEERAITNGEPFGPKRLLMMADGVAAVLLRLGEAGRHRHKTLAKFAAGYFPLGWAHFTLWYAFLALHAARALAAHVPGVPAALVPAATPALDAVVVVWIAPNVLRSFCLNFVSSKMHYFGDVAPGNLLQQTQVLDDVRFLPLQLFCFNFGSTHAIHHFVANEPFYVRQWTAREAHAVMRDNGVPFNDLGTFRRANRRGEWSGAIPGRAERAGATPPRSPRASSSSRSPARAW